MTDNGDSRVRSVMVPSPIMVDGLATVADAIALMKSNQISSLVIDRRDDDDEYGLLTVTNIASRVIGEELAPERTNVYEIMSKPVLTVDTSMRLKYAVRMLVRFGLSRALVMEQGELVGIVTMRDMVMRYLAPGED